MRRWYRYSAVLALSALPGAVGAAAPFAVDGLHLDLPFNEAVAWAERGGASCSVRDSRTQSGRKRADCRYPACTADSATADCGQRSAPSDDTIVHDVSWVGLEAQADTTPLTRAVVQFGDSATAVAEALRRAFGPPATEHDAGGSDSWSHSRGRLGWTEGVYHMGLLDAERMIILTVERPPPAAGTE